MQAVIGEYNGGGDTGQMMGLPNLIEHGLQRGLELVTANRRCRVAAAEQQRDTERPGRCSHQTSAAASAIAVAARATASSISAAVSTVDSTKNPRCAKNR